MKPFFESHLSQNCREKSGWRTRFVGIADTPSTHEFAIAMRTVFWVSAMLSAVK